MPGNNPARHWPGTQLPQWPCVGFHTDSGTGIIGVAHLHTHNCTAFLIPSTMTKPYCTQQIISLVGGSMLQRSLVVCQAGSLARHSVLCKTLWFSCSLGHWRIEADWTEMERETVKNKCDRGFKKCINTISNSFFSPSFTVSLSVICQDLKRKKKTSTPEITLALTLFLLKCWHDISRILWRT